MLYRVADLYVEMSALGDMPERMRSYEAGSGQADISITEQDLDRGGSRFKTITNNDLFCYMETGRVFYNKIIPFDGMMLHASAVVIDGYAYLFSGPCGMGKSTHAGLYLKAFGDRARIINDDKPALRRIGGVWYAYGTPWCGKDGINLNERARLGGICFLKRGDRKITRLAPADVLPLFMPQTERRIEPGLMRLLLPCIDRLVREVPFFEFYNHADPEDAAVTFAAMREAAKEAANETQS